jgi:signal transduction histidine kinase/ActR/RegA family two-component response regulator
MSDARIIEAEARIKELEEKLRDLTSNTVDKHNYDLLLKELEKAKVEAFDAVRTKTIFLANMSHEIRTPMNSIIGIYNILDQTRLSPEQRELLEVINISSHNLLAIINDILDFSRIKAGQLKVEYKPFILNEEIHLVIKMLSLKAKGKGLDLSSRIESAVPECLVGDAVRLNQILVNLTNNALKYTLEGSVIVSVEKVETNKHATGYHPELIPESLKHLKTLPPNKVLIKFEVKDTGVGISEEEQVNLFQEYCQVENPLIKQYEGTGLGLSISKNLIEMMNGRIGVISEIEKGSTFWFTILFEIGDINDLRNKIKKDHKKVKKSRPLDILLVEDNILNQKFAATTLERVGHRVEIAENGKVAFDKYRENHYDLIIMDIAMPIMDGLEATQAIRKYEKELDEKNPSEARPAVRIIAVTAYVIMTDREKCLKSGMDEYLAKPYRPKELTEIIDQLEIE